MSYSANTTIATQYSAGVCYVCAAPAALPFCHTHAHIVCLHDLNADDSSAVPRLACPECNRNVYRLQRGERYTHSAHASVPPSETQTASLSNYLLKFAYRQARKPESAAQRTVCYREIYGYMSRYPVLYNGSLKAKLAIRAQLANVYTQTLDPYFADVYEEMFGADIMHNTQDRLYPDAVRCRECATLRKPNHRSHCGHSVCKPCVDQMRLNGIVDCAECTNPTLYIGDSDSN